MPPKGAKKKASSGYQMPEQFTAGTVLNDIFKKPWCLGKPIGQGGFGLIYTANRGESQPKNSDDAEFVIKIEPKSNGPLFSEIHFYTACAKEDELKKFASLRSLKHLAIPRFISSGTCTYNDKEFRFLVMDRYSTDLQRILNKPGAANRLTSEIGVLCLMQQVLWSLQYMHERGYAHGDVKGANLMLKNDNEAYLVDYGLAFKFRPRDSDHLPYAIKPERRHNGTIEYTSRDAHAGANISRRSDLEILGYCVIHWMCGKLPWIDLIKNPVHVQDSKNKSMDNVKEFLSRTLQAAGDISDSFVKFIEFYLNEVNTLEFETEPDYAKIHKKIGETLASLGHPKTAKDNFYIFKPAAKLAKVIDKSKADDKESLPEFKITDKVVAKKRLENGGTLTPSRKRQQSIDDMFDSDSNDSLKSTESSSKKSRKKQTKLTDETNDELLEVAKKSPLIKIKKKESSKTKSNLVQSPLEPARATPKRAVTAKLRRSYVDTYVSDTDSEIDYLPLKQGDFTPEVAKNKSSPAAKTPAVKTEKVTAKLDPKIRSENQDSSERIDQQPKVIQEKANLKQNNGGVLSSLGNGSSQERCQFSSNDDMNKTKSQNKMNRAERVMHMLNKPKVFNRSQVAHMLGLEYAYTSESFEIVNRSPLKETSPVELSKFVHMPISSRVALKRSATEPNFSYCDEYDSEYDSDQYVSVKPLTKPFKSLKVS